MKNKCYVIYSIYLKLPMVFVKDINGKYAYIFVYELKRTINLENLYDCVK